MEVVREPPPVGRYEVVFAELQGSDESALEALRSLVQRALEAPGVVHPA